MINPRNVCLHIRSGLKEFKQNLHEAIGRTVGHVARTADDLHRLDDSIIPMVQCHIELQEIINKWIRRKRSFIYWDRGYVRRHISTDLPMGLNGGYYRCHLNSYQMEEIRDVPDDRWKSFKVPTRPWSNGGRHIIVAEPSETYQAYHNVKHWKEETKAALQKLTDRPLIDRIKLSGRKLAFDLNGAHALVTHGSMVAVEAVIMGCPVFVHPSSAAALVGQTDLNLIESPIYPDRQAWLYSLAYNQWDEREILNGTLWKMIQ